MDLRNIHYVYLIGIGGIGMSALARYFRAGGKEVCGYDKTSTTLTDELIQEGIAIHFEDAVEYLPVWLKEDKVNPSALVIYTPAIPKDHREWNYLHSAGYSLNKRSEVLGWLTSNSTTIAVAGTHGKTTTSTMITHILHHSGVNCTAFLGGISKNFHSNLVIGQQDNDHQVMVVEADEYDRSFLQLHPDYAIITSLDPDHLDIYGSREAMVASYRQFALQVKKPDQLIVKKGLDQELNMPRIETYSAVPGAGYSAANIHIVEGAYHFDIVSGSRMVKGLTLVWPGRHNVENAVGAYAVCRKFGLTDEQFKNGLETFEGVVRRFDYRLRTPQVVLIDDYAHHPAEIRAAIGSVKEMYPGRKILAIFQPHLYSRTRDFAFEFAESLSLADELILLDIYPAREIPIEGVSSEMILEQVTVDEKKICLREHLTDRVLQSDVRVVLMLGAGDIDQLVDPVQLVLEEKYLKQNVR